MDPAPQAGVHPRRVVVAGGGVGGIEAVLALRSLAAARVDVTVVEPTGRFRMAATATGRVFGVGQAVEMPFTEIVARTGVRHRPGRLSAVDTARRLVVLGGGETLGYDSLVVAVGARPHPFLPEALTFTGHADAPETRALLEGMAADQGRGTPRDLAVVVPPECGWPIAAYELALMARRMFMSRPGTPGRVMVVTSEERPLALFGEAASDAVTVDLARAGVELEPGATVTGWRPGCLELADRPALAVDRVIALPQLAGPAIPGLPLDGRGFVRTRADGSVPGAPDVWVAGDAGSFPVKQGGIACQQADVAAAAIARAAGATVPDEDPAPVLRGWVWDGGAGRFIRWSEAGAADERDALWWPVMKVAGRHLSPFLRGLPSSIHMTDVDPVPDAGDVSPASL